MQVFSTIPTASPPSASKQSREPLRTGVPQVEPVEDEQLRDSPREDVLARPMAPDEPEPPQIEAESYRLNFDEEKRRLYLELLNPVTGDVIQRMPRDDLAFVFATDEETPLQGVSISV